jgi:hypothetical protein
MLRAINNDSNHIEYLQHAQQPIDNVRDWVASPWSSDALSVTDITSGSISSGHDASIVRLMHSTMAYVAIMLQTPTPSEPDFNSNRCAWDTLELLSSASTIPFVAPGANPPFPHTPFEVPVEADLDWTSVTGASIPLDGTWRLGVIQAIDWGNSGFGLNGLAVPEIGRGLVALPPATPRAFILPLSGGHHCIRTVSQLTSRLDQAPNPPFTCSIQRPFWEQRYQGGSGTTFHVALDPAGGPPTVHVMPVLGPTEIFSDVRRYKCALKYSRREFILLETNTSQILLAGWPSVVKP